MELAVDLRIVSLQYSIMRPGKNARGLFLRDVDEIMFVEGALQYAGRPPVGTPTSINAFEMRDLAENLEKNRVAHFKKFPILSVAESANQPDYKYAIQINSEDQRKMVLEALTFIVRHSDSLDTAVAAADMLNEYYADAAA